MEVAKTISNISDIWDYVIAYLYSLIPMAFFDNYVYDLWEKDALFIFMIIYQYLIIITISTLCLLWVMQVLSVKLYIKLVVQCMHMLTLF